MIVSTVMFRLKRPLAAEDRERFLAGLRDLGAEPPFAAGPALVVESLQLRGSEKPGAADAMTRMEFSDKAAYDSYTAAARHAAFTSEFGPLFEKVLASQYEVA